MTSTYRIRSVVEEEAPAWEECEKCGGSKYEKEVDHGLCPTCNGEGGRWHPLVWVGEENHYFGGVESSDMVIVTKSSILIREHEVCSGKLCGGKGYFNDGYHNGTKMVSEKVTCKKCNGTGAEPNTAGPWRVK